jgi:hypothetical protein
MTTDPMHADAEEYIRTLPKDVQPVVITYLLKILSHIRRENLKDDGVLRAAALIEDKTIVHLRSAYTLQSTGVNRNLTGPPPGALNL